MTLMKCVVTPWVRCEDCGKIVKVNKPLLGDLHLCVENPPKK